MYQHETVTDMYLHENSSQLICTLHEAVVNWYVPTRDSSQLICTLHEAVVNWYVSTPDSSQLICTYTRQ